MWGRTKSDHFIRAGEYPKFSQKCFHNQKFFDGSGNTPSYFPALMKWSLLVLPHISLYYLIEQYLLVQSSYILRRPQNSNKSPYSNVKFFWPSNKSSILISCLYCNAINGTRYDTFGSFLSFTCMASTSGA